MCVPIDNRDWPAIGDMADRIIILALGLIIANFKPLILNHSTISVTLIIIGLVTHLGTLSRIFYAKKIIDKNQK